MPQALAVVGNSNSGKTAVAVTLVETLESQGYRVAVIKHCPHGHDVDRVNSDTHRLYGAGAAIVVAYSPDKLTRVDRVDGDDSLDAIIASFGHDVDLVIAEGFKASSLPKVLVEKDGEPSPSVDNVIATVGPCAGRPDVPNYHLEELHELVAQVRKQFLEMPQPELSASLVVDGVPIPLSRFPTSALTRIVEGFLSSLKGVPGDPTDIRITIRDRRSE